MIMNTRAKLLTALAAGIILAVAAPLAAGAYWAVTSELAVSAKASTFSIAPYAVSPASGSSATIAGSAGTAYLSAALTNDGATPWAAHTAAVTGTGLGPEASATLQVVVTASQGVCQSDGTYAGIAAQSALGTSTWTAPSAVASGATVYACMKVVVADTGTRTPTDQAAPESVLTLTTTTTAKQHNWTDTESATATVTSTRWAACKETGNDAVLFLPSNVPTGSYTVVRNDTGARFTGIVTSGSRAALSLSNPATSGSEGTQTYVTVLDANGGVLAVARMTFTSSFRNNSFTKSLGCA